MTITTQAEAVDFEALVQAGQEAVTRYLLSRADSAAEAGEWVQECFVRAYCALAKGDRPRHPLAWLLAIARNVYVDAVRARTRERAARERLALLMGPGWRSPWHDGVTRRVVVGQALESLPPDLREPVLLHYFAGLSVRDVAGHLEITAGAVKTRLWRAREALREDLEVLMSNADKHVTFHLPRDLAARAKHLAEKPPWYDSIDVGLYVGGRRNPTCPTWEPQAVEGQLSLEDLRVAVQRLHAARLAGDRPLAARLGFHPTMELFEHPQPAAVWRYLEQATIRPPGHVESEEDRLCPTDGWRLGTDPEAPRLLAEAREAGMKYLWFTLAGHGVTHDDLCRRPGAFEAIRVAMARAKEAGFLGGANLIVSTRSAPEVQRMAETVLAGIGDDPNQFMPLYVDAWSRLNSGYEEVRPEPEQVQGLPPATPPLNWGYPAFWADPAAWTEGALTRAARAGDEQWERKLRTPTPRTLALWVLPNFDLCVWDVAQPHPGRRLANLRADSPAQVHEALAALPSPPPSPSYRELAARYGGSDSRKLYMVQGEWNQLLHKWLAQWRGEG
jgi:RNA polymerase sigma-70 factor, ECF subfamily